MPYWRVLEMIEPREIPRPTPARDKRQPGTDIVEAIELRPGQPVPPLPWQEGHRRREEQPRESRYGSVWRHTVYGGVFKFQAVRRELARELRFELDEDHAGVHDQESALFAFVVDAQGRLLDGTGAFSSCAWAAGRFGRLRKGDPGAFDGYETAAGKCEQALARLLSSHVQYPERLSARITDRASASGAANAGKERHWRGLLAELLGGAGSSAVSTAIGGSGAVLDGAAGTAAGTGAANTAAATAAAPGSEQGASGTPPGDASESGPQQAAQPGDGAQDSRAVQALDIVALVGAVADHLRLPPGLLNALEIRVESKPVARRKDGSLPDPESAFLSSMIAPDLKRVAEAGPEGYGPALSSYLSGPLPSAKKVDLRDEDKRVVLREGTNPDAFPSGRWPAGTDQALVVSQQFAVNTIIGNKDTALFAVNGPPGTGKTTLLRDLIAAIVVSRATELAKLKSARDAFVVRAIVERPDGMAGRLRGPRDELTGFEVVVASSNNAAVENVTKELPALKAIGEEWRGEGDYFKAQATAFLNQPDGNTQGGNRKSQKKSPAEAWGLLAVPLGNAANRKRFSDWFRWNRDGGMYSHLTRLAQDRPPPEDWAAAKERFETALAAERTLAVERAAAYQACFEPVDELEKRSREDARRLEDAERNWPGNYPGTWHQEPQDEQERQAPWSDEEWTRARTEVFLAGLDLHRACVEANAREVRDTLTELCKVLARDPSRTTDRDAERAAWQTLFFLIPVLSTTFASTGRMFGFLGKEELGWVLIDEAGQALPQAAAGALWRAKRAVVVGDPRQLEPIYQLPAQVQRELANPFGVAADFIPAGRSAQALADRRSRLGTSVKTDADPVWVGMPLRVHRRCESPMFEMSNELAYGGLMVQGTVPQRLPAAGEECPPSSWFDVRPRTVSGRWADEQGTVLGRTLTGLLIRHGVPLEQVYVLSPFRAVARECRAVARNTLRASFEHTPEGLDEFLAKHIGTVHTMQGKEADVVILVLGTDQTPRHRARDWVGASPNLLNVAVSRPRRRLYVIGSYAEWRDAPNFGVFAPSAAFPKYEFFV